MAHESSSSEWKQSKHWGKFPKWDWDFSTLSYSNLVFTISNVSYLARRKKNKCNCWCYTLNMRQIFCVAKPATTTQYCTINRYSLSAVYCRLINEIFYDTAMIFSFLGKNLISPSYGPVKKSGHYQMRFCKAQPYSCDYFLVREVILYFF